MPIHSFHTDGKLETYFRGRKLRGQEIGVPQDYRGVVVQEARNEKAAFERIEKADVENEEGYEMEEQEEITIWREVGSFDNLLLWNHESMIDGNDAFVKGLSEWIGFAEAVSHVFPVCGRRIVRNHR